MVSRGKRVNRPANEAPALSGPVAEGRPPVLVVAGPTGAGKSAAALLLGSELNGVIINADSRQVYRDFSIITARPGPDDLARCPHELYGFLETEARLSAGRWADMARVRVEAAHAAGKLPILTGGTGLYLKALLDGMAEIPPVDPEISAALAARCQAEGAPALHAELVYKDAAYAARIHPNDRQRIVRALEVIESTGYTFTWWHSRTPAPPAWTVLRYGMGLPLQELEPRLRQRIELMLEAGALAEARTAMTRCADAAAPGWSGIGCAELLAHVRGTWSLEAAREAWAANTRAYAKRQLTWFRADARLVWFRPGQETSLLEHARRLLKPVCAGPLSGV